MLHQNHELFTTISGGTYWSKMRKPLETSLHVRPRNCINSSINLTGSLILAPSQEMLERHERPSSVVTAVQSFKHQLASCTACRYFICGIFLRVAVRVFRM